MAQSSLHWRITPDASNDQAYPILALDPVWNSFGLADLEPPMREYSQFAIASQDDSGKQAISLIVRHPIIGQVLSPFGDAEGVAAILQHISLPEHVLIQAQEIHISALQRYYQPETVWRAALRMAITPGQEQTPSYAPPQAVKQLTLSDLPALRDLYAQYPESAFAAELFTEGLYFGAYQGERIVAAGGTHALTPAHRIAVLGNVLTAPEARGQGYATAITSSLVAALFTQQFARVALNVFEDNVQAVRIYQRIGFQAHHRLMTGKALLSREHDEDAPQ